MANFIKHWEHEKMKPEQIGFTDLGNNPKLVETAGFIPLPERIKQMVLSGEQLANARDVFDSSDYREMFADVGDNFLEYGDDIEEITLKYRAVLAKQKEILERKGYIQKAVQPNVDGSPATSQSEVKDSGETKKSDS